MSEDINSWPALSFLEGLRPGPDEQVELALLASYSADIGSIGAVLLALVGKDSDSGRGSPSDFAEAVERLRGKVRIVIQRGRLAKMSRTPRIAAVLDQFVREVDFDEATHSWHPKAALVRMRGANGELSWRLWIGSRNLTECVNRDIGLLLTSGEKGATRIPGADDLARALADRAGLKGVNASTVAKSIQKVKWRAPAGVKVERIRWSDGDGNQDVPVPPAGSDKMVVVSPFIDKTFLARQVVKGTKPVRRTLLTTMSEIERIGPSLAAFDELLILDAPEYPLGDPAPDPDDATVASDSGAQDDEEQEIGRGLHAKLLFTQSGRERRLWLGSANATIRAWTGRNAEVMAELLVSEGVENGLKAILGSARQVEAPTVEQLPDSETMEDEAIERARTQVAARWTAQLRVEDNELCLFQCPPHQDRSPHPDAHDIMLEVGPLHGELRPWPRGETTVELGPVVPAERSEFVRLRVSRSNKGLSWLQRAPADPPFGEERDRAAFVHFLGAKGFLLWLAGLLADHDWQAEGDWTKDEQQERSDSRKTQALDTTLPTLEAILAAWVRNPEKFGEIEERVSQYLPAVLEQAGQEDPKTVEMIVKFSELWGRIQIGLGTSRTRNKRR